MENVTLDRIYNMVWRRLEKASMDATNPGRTPAMSTVNRQGHPENRLVVLRGSIEDEAKIEIHTDLASQKMADISNQPTVSLCFWD